MSFSYFLPLDKNKLLIFCRFSIILVLLLICSGNITNSVLLKYGFRDTQKSDEEYTQTFSLIGMMQGTAPKPFVYRSTFAKLAKWTAAQLNPTLQEKLFDSIKRFDSLRNAYFNGVPEWLWTPVIAIAYHILYAAVVLATIFTLLIIYKLARMHGYAFGAALSFMVGFSLIYPLTFQRGGYFYDFFEILGVFGAVYFFLRQRMLVCTCFTALFSFNKETFFLVPLALFFLYGSETSFGKRIRWLILQLTLCLLGRLIIMHGYETNAGSFVMTNPLGNFLFWLNPESYLVFYNLVAKGVFTPGLQNPFILIPVIMFFRYAWRETNQRYKRYFFAAFLPILGLFIFFGYEDEARNFSLAFPAIVLIALNGANRFNSIFAPVDVSQRQCV